MYNHIYCLLATINSFYILMPIDDQVDDIKLSATTQAMRVLKKMCSLSFLPRLGDDVSVRE